jgi:hypothetical protein
MEMHPAKKKKSNPHDSSSALIIIPTEEDILSSPVLRERQLVDAEVCALQVLSWYASNRTKIDQSDKKIMPPKTKSSARMTIIPSVPLAPLLLPKQQHHQQPPLLTPQTSDMTKNQLQLSTMSL